MRFADFAVVDQTDSERLEGLCQKSSSGYSKKCSPQYSMYVPTDTDSVDVTTRLSNAFVSCEMWWKGPDLLHLENIDTPWQNFLRPGKVSEEQKIETMLLASSERFFGIGEVVDNSRFRSLQKSLRVTSYVRWFPENLKVNLGKDRKVSSGEISTEEIDSRN